MKSSVLNEDELVKLKDSFQSINVLKRVVYSCVLLSGVLYSSASYKHLGAGKRRNHRNRHSSNVCELL